MLKFISENRWKIITVVLACTISYCVAIGFAKRLQKPPEEPIPEPPAPVALDRVYSNPPDYTSVPSFGEIDTYAKIAGRRTLTPQELSRIVEILSISQHTLTLLRGYAIILSVDITSHQAQIVAMAIEGTKHPHYTVRASAMNVLSKYDNPEHAKAIIRPFLNSRDDAPAARTILTRMGVEVP